VRTSVKVVYRELARYMLEIKGGKRICCIQACCVPKWSDACVCVSERMRITIHCIVLFIVQYQHFSS
jgi:hypothetical protein